MPKAMYITKAATNTPAPANQTDFLNRTLPRFQIVFIPRYEATQHVRARAVANLEASVKPMTKVGIKPSSTSDFWPQEEAVTKAIPPRTTAGKAQILIKRNHQGCASPAIVTPYMTAPRLQKPSQEKGESVTSKAVRTKRTEPTKAMAEKISARRSAREVKTPDNCLRFSMLTLLATMALSEKKAPNWAEDTNKTMIQIVIGDTMSLKITRGQTT